jgi:hypothetical protein
VIGVRRRELELGGYPEVERAFRSRSSRHYRVHGREGFVGGWRGSSHVRGVRMWIGRVAGVPSNGHWMKEVGGAGLLGVAWLLFVLMKSVFVVNSAVGFQVVVDLAGWVEKGPVVGVLASMCAV